MEHEQTRLQKELLWQRLEGCFVVVLVSNVVENSRNRCSEILNRCLVHFMSSIISNLKPHGTAFHGKSGAFGKQTNKQLFLFDSLSSLQQNFRTTSNFCFTNEHTSKTVG
ncbi:unnamed protein product, partial [Amoebophrya sp. A120]|eukprot:GSA120T00012480001.1